MLDRIAAVLAVFILLAITALVVWRMRHKVDEPDWDADEDPRARYR